MLKFSLGFPRLCVTLEKIQQMPRKPSLLFTVAACKGKMLFVLVMKGNQFLSTEKH